MKMRSLVYLLPLIALWHFAELDPPITMIVIATTLFVAIKTHSLLLYIAGPKRGAAKRRLADLPKSDLLLWFTAWWGLQPSEFFERTDHLPISWPALAFICAKIALGILLLAFVAPYWVASSQGIATRWIGGWIGMVGIVFMMHFGYSHLTAILLNARGFPVKPIMNFPLISNTVSEFWGRRWNVAFRDYAYATLFSPLSRRFGIQTGTAAGFLFSGLIHEMAISVPARGGYGWPMLYFVIQGFGAVVERRLQKAGKLESSSQRNRAWTILVVLLPAPLLFHKQFVFEVINPIIEWCDLSWLVN